MIPGPLPDRSVWRNRAFVLLWAAQAISQTAQNAIWYALLVLVEELSHSTTHLGITILSVIVPSILFGVPAGVYVDRWDKRTVLIATNGLRAGIVAAYVLLQSVLGLLYLGSFVFSLVSQFFAPAELAMIPALVGRRKLMEASSLFHLTFTASQLLGLVFLGPVVVKLFGAPTFFLVAAALYVLCAALVWPLPAQPPRGEEARPQTAFGVLMAELREVGQLLLADRVMLWSMAYWTLGVGITLMVAMIAPRFVVDALGIAAQDTVFVMGPGFAGTLLAAAWLSRISPSTWEDRHRLIGRGLALVGAALAVVAAAPALARAAGLLRPEGVPVDTLTEWDLLVVGAVMLGTFLGGFGFTAVMVSAQTSLQDRAPAEARGRVFAVQLMLGNLGSVLPLLFFGGVADLFGVNRVLLVLAALILFARALGRRLGPPPVPPIP